ncbi:MAG: glycosyltransferase [Gemmatimonadota bacterium]|nr:glycosyltransferase [Gemmatimonadota bacterium]
MRILLLAPRFSRSSPVQGAWVLARHVHRCGEEVIFAALEGGGQMELLEGASDAGPILHEFDMNSWRALNRLGRVRDFVQAAGVDVVVSYAIRPDLVNTALKGRCLRVCSVREDFDAWPRRYGSLKGRLAARTMLRIWNSVDLVITQTTAQSEQLRVNGVRTKTVTVPNFVDVDGIHSAISGTRNHYSPLDQVQIGYFGRLSRTKRVDLTLEAIARLSPAALSKVRYELAGDGPEREVLERQALSLGISERVTFHGHLDSPFGLMNRMSIVLLASESEGVPRCLMEAMALGKTCIATDLPGTRALIEHGVTGYLVPQGDYEALARQMETAIRGDDLLAPAAPEQHIRANHDVEVCGDRFLSYLRELVAERAFAPVR